MTYHDEPNPQAFAPQFTLRALLALMVVVGVIAAIGAAAWSGRAWALGVMGGLLVPACFVIGAAIFYSLAALTLRMGFSVSGRSRAYAPHFEPPLASAQPPLTGAQPPASTQQSPAEGDLP